MELRLKEIRKTRGLTQEDMAQALGAKLPTYRTWERGTVPISLETACECAKILNCSIDEIAGIECDPRASQIMYCYLDLSEAGKEAALGAVSGIAKAFSSEEDGGSRDGSDTQLTA
ncbi:helix-turn-helix transcriptional regulator [Denitrobacterium detoxificans]|uniref:DNA-binding transcriptional regulator, XRE-family HTH domain n=1 Tax=Denitrobacterium detoxificans TaxID=79604 RepID=A0A1H8UA50_9ACTN|nr:helix-turn-helix transcriptional regulator [Denitrobacterium detoxificans]SEO99917.1 DNA-binding transcriptional regulator, XRE-family HTH domain [Denitrobacterium detoxificans]